MPIVIGARPERSFQDPIGLLTDCHRRVERFLSVLVEVGTQAQGGSLTAEQRVALDAALRYFREAAPKHTADEEESLFPRLRTLDHPELQPVIDRVQALQEEHIQAEKSHAELDRLGRAWLEARRLPDADAMRFSHLAAELERLYRDHIAVEEREVFPAASAALGNAQREAIGNEMAARRGLRQPVVTGVTG